MVGQRASSRLAAKGLRTYASWFPVRTQKKIERKLRTKGVWNAVRNLYNIEKGNVSSRMYVSKYFAPKHRKYNASKNVFVNGRNANRAIDRAIRQKYIANILVPFSGSRGGVEPSYVVNAIKNANVNKYAIINRNNKSLKAFALIKNPNRNSRYINVIAGFTSYGHPMMNKILNNARAQGKNRVNLKAVVQTTNNNSKANNDPLVKWYMSKGFKRSGVLNSGQLLPMSIKL